MIFLKMWKYRVLRIIPPLITYAIAKLVLLLTSHPILRNNIDQITSAVVICTFLFPTDSFIISYILNLTKIRVIIVEDKAGDKSKRINKVAVIHLDKMSSENDLDLINLRYMQKCSSLAKIVLNVNTLSGAKTKFHLYKFALLNMDTIKTNGILLEGQIAMIMHKRLNVNSTASGNYYLVDMY